LRLADFILANTESILLEWERFARSTTPGAAMNRLELRDHAEVILRATVMDMTSAQTPREGSAKSNGHGESGEGSLRLDRASAVHGLDRVDSGFDLMEVVSEYRALRDSVVRLWRAEGGAPDANDLDDLTRFNQSIDQSLTESVVTYTRRVDRSRRMFLAILGHDLRNPLSCIMMSTGVVADSANANSQSTEAATQIEASVLVIANLVRDLLDFAGTGLGAAMPLTPASVDMHALCLEVLEEFRIARPFLTTNFQSQGELLGYWDHTRLRQVMSNLIGNAAQHGPREGPITINLKVDGDEVVLSVHNGGSPIRANVLPTIFDPLVRAPLSDSQKRRRPGSIGLGLYIAREIVTGHGGRIDVTSSLEEGTTFVVRLPRSRFKPAAAAPTKTTR